MDIKTYRAKYNELQKQIEEHGKAMLLEGFKQLFEAVPELEAVRWEQSSPHFNDGEPCTFSRYDFTYKFASAKTDEEDTAEEAEEKEEDEYDDEDDEDFIDYCYDDTDPRGGLLKKVDKAMETAQLDLGELEGVYENTFGDGYRITVTRDLEVDVEEYDHD
jgi:hypothetical protein